MSTPSKTTGSSNPIKVNSLRLYCLGPGIGESIVVQLPDGKWGVVDCYDKPGRPGTVTFLQEKEVQHLSFFCLTHPHHDHFTGAYRLLESYSGKIDHIWQHPGFTSVDYSNLAVTAAVRHQYQGDPEAGEFSTEYRRFIEASVIEGKRLSPKTYRQVIAPLSLLSGKNYTIEAVEPNTQTMQAFQKRFAGIVVKAGPLLLSEEGGSMINSVSLVLHIKFGEADVFLLGDAQGADLQPDPSVKRFSVVKIAHHGSSNGWGADLMTANGGNGFNVDHAVVTPFAHCHLPREDMVDRYTQSCETFLRTDGGTEPPKRVIAGLANLRVISKNSKWIGLEVFPDSQVRRIL